MNRYLSKSLIHRILCSDPGAFQHSKLHPACLPWPGKANHSSLLSSTHSARRRKETGWAQTPPTAWPPFRKLGAVRSNVSWLLTLLTTAPQLFFPLLTLFKQERNEEKREAWQEIHVGEGKSYLNKGAPLRSLLAFALGAGYSFMNWPTETGSLDGRKDCFCQVFRTNVRGEGRTTQSCFMQLVG